MSSSRGCQRKNDNITTEACVERLALMLRRNPKVLLYPYFKTPLEKDKAIAVVHKIIKSSNTIRLTASSLLLYGAHYPARLLPRDIVTGIVQAECEKPVVLSNILFNERYNCFVKLTCMQYLISMHLPREFVAASALLNIAAAGMVNREALLGIVATAKETKQYRMELKEACMFLLGNL